MSVSAYISVGDLVYGRTQPMFRYGSASIEDVANWLHAKKDRAIKIVERVCNTKISDGIVYSFHFARLRSYVIDRISEKRDTFLRNQKRIEFARRLKNHNQTNEFNNRQLIALGII